MTQNRLAARHLMILLGVALAVAPPAGACPAYLRAQDLDLPAGKRSEVRLFAWSGGAWRRLPVQVDPLDEGGVLRAPTTGAPDLDEQLTSPLDRVALRVEGFGDRADPAAPAPCAAGRAIELVSAELRYAYLTVCENDRQRLPSSAMPVTLDQTSLRISGPRFEYDYLPNNQLMYRKLTAKSPRWPVPLVAATDSDLNLHLDLKRFFTMDFTNRDVESYVGRTHVGGVGLVGSMDFFLRLLFFKIDLKMATTVGFYEDSAHIPAIIDVPRDAPRMLHPGSGLLYTWTPGATVFDQSEPAKTLPHAEPPAILAGWEKTAERGRPYCALGVDQPCVFRLRGTIADARFGLDINVPRPMVDRGFFPQWVADVALFKRAMGWDDDPPEAPGVVAVYFDNGGLLKGQYTFDQWIRIGRHEDFAERCPRVVSVGPALTFPKPIVVSH